MNKKEKDPIVSGGLGGILYEKRILIAAIIAGLLFVGAVILIVLEGSGKTFVVNNNTDKKIEYIKAYFIGENMEYDVEVGPMEEIPEEEVPQGNAEIESNTETPEETVPEETIPEETVPEEIVPEETVPEETVPEETVPEETVPEEITPEEVPNMEVKIGEILFENIEPGQKVTKDIEKINLNMIGAEMEVLVKFEGAEEMTLNTGYFDYNFYANTIMDFKQEKEEYILEMKVANDIFMKSDPYHANYYYTINMEEGYMD